MGYYVPKNELPTDCRDCYYNIYDQNTGESLCDAGMFIMQEDSKALPFEGRHSDCPLIDLSNHGRLVDADALLRLVNNCLFPSDMVTTSAVRMAVGWINDATTVIPAAKK